LADYQKPSPGVVKAVREYLKKARQSQSTEPSPARLTSAMKTYFRKMRQDLRAATQPTPAIKNPVQKATEVTRSESHRLRSLDKTLSSKISAQRVGAKTTARALASQPETLRKIYSRAGAEISDAWRTQYKPWFNRHPKLRAAAMVLAGMTIADAALPEKQARLKGVRDPSDSPYLEVDGISFGPCGRGVARALTDFGSGRRFGNPVTRGFNELSAYRSSLDIRYPDIDGVSYKSLEKSHETWTSAMMSANRRLFHRGEYDMARGSWLKTAGLNRSAWMGVVDLKNYHVKVSDADSITVKRRGLMNMFKKPVSIRLAGIDAPEVEHPGMSGRIAEDQFAGKQGAEYFEHLIERQQSLRLVFDPSSRSYNRHVGVLIGDRRANLNLQLVRGGAAAALPWQSRKRQIVDHNAYASAEALAASGKIGMWQSKGWQMHRAMGLIAGKRVTNTTMTSLDRITRSAALSDWYGLVQRAHDSSRSPWTPDEVQDMYQVGSAYRAETMGRLNKRTKNAGFLPGIRGPVTPWSIVGSGITPTQVRGGNVSDFSSGRAKITAVQSAVNERYGSSPIDSRTIWNTTVNNLNATSVPIAVTSPMLPSAPVSADPLGAGTRPDLTQAVNHYPGESGTRPDLHRTTPVNMGKGVGPIYTGTGELYVHSSTTGKYRVIDTPKRTLAAYPDAKARDVIFQTYKDGGHGFYVNDVDAYLEQVDDAAQAQHAKPPQSPTRKPTPTTTAKPPKAIKVVDRSIPARNVPVPPSSGMKSSSSRYHGIGPAAGIGALVLTGVAIGTWAMLKGDEQGIGERMMDTPRHPREFMGMRPHGDFVASHKVGAWAQHQNMGVAAEEAASAHKREALKHLGLQGVVMGLERYLAPNKHPMLEAWDSFVKAGHLLDPAETLTPNQLRESKVAGKKVKAGLKAMKYDQMSRHAWMRRRKMSTSFITNIASVADTKLGWFDKILKKFSWESIKEAPGKLWDYIESKQSKLTKDASGNVKDWFKSIATKSKHWTYGVDANEIQRLKKMGKLNKLVGAKKILAWDQFTHALSENVKNLVTNPQGFMAKVTGVKDIITNFGRLEEMALAYRVIDKKSLLAKKEVKNVFTNIGKRLKDINKNSPLFTAHVDKMRRLTKVGSSISKFGKSGVGRALGKIPYMNVAWGAIEGYSLMDQYENATKGFITETAAGTARMAAFALIRPGLWLAAGAKLAAAGSALGPAGTIGGAILGFVGSAVINLVGSFVLGEVAATAVRYPTAAVLGARKRRNPDPSMSMDPAMLYQMGGIQGMRGPVNQFNRFHGMDPARPDMTPFGGAYNPIQGQDIDSKTLQITESKRKITSSPKAGRPISMFTPTFGLVNNVLWNQRRGSRVRSVIERYSGMNSVPKLDRNRSRMAARAA